jgi:aminoglycoside phosphotransferase (APT) family kinase protein
VPRGVAHGDFWAENLLVADGRLRGVVDWSGAGAGRLPLLDLYHLLVDRAEGMIGDAIVSWLLPAVASGGGPLVASYCARVGLDRDPELLRALAAAYWLEHIAHHLRSYADRAERPAWLARNVHAPAAALLR